MKNLLFLCLTLYLTRGNLCQNEKFMTSWFNQSLDHFDNQNSKIWKQRYFTNDEFFDQSRRNVAFLFVEGQSEAANIWMTNGDWYEYAQQFNAMLFLVEHRFYGESRPTDDLSVDNMKYLTIQQATADLAEFVVAMNKEHNLSEEVKWIAFGASYPGILAADLRVKYPHLIDGAVSTSAPMSAIVDFKDYYRVVADDLRQTDKNCLSAVRAATAQIKALLQDRAGSTALTSLFQLCTPLEEVIDNEDEISSFFDSLSNNIAVIAQFNKANRLSTRDTPLANVTLETICDIMTDSSKREIDRLASVNSLMLNGFDETCVDYSYANTIDNLINGSWDAAFGGRQQLFQFCNELGFFQTSTKETAFGDIPIEWHLKKCSDIFGPRFDKTYLNRAIAKTNIFFEELKNKASNVVFVHGSVDPWHKLGITKSTNENAPAIFIQGTAHCANMYPSSVQDLPQLTAARGKIGQLIHSWVNL